MIRYGILPTIIGGANSSKKFPRVNGVKLFSFVSFAVKMPKRPNPFGDCSPLQLKQHVGKKEVDMGVGRDQNMKDVYGKQRKGFAPMQFRLEHRDL